MRISFPVLVFPLFLALSLQPSLAADVTEAKIVHFEVVGEIADPHVQIPPTDADLYADVTDKVSLSFDWDKDEQAFVGSPTFKNYPGTATNLKGMDDNCPGGSINGPYEHFDIVEIKLAAGVIELVGKRVHPETSVAESCGAGRTTYKGADTPVTVFTAPPDPAILAVLSMLPADGPLRGSPDGKSVVMTAMNNNWTWTFTPSVTR